MEDNAPKITQARSQYYPFPEPYVPEFEQERIREEMKWKPTVSIILPCWNAHNTLKRTLCSIGMQDMINEIEVILADDCGDVPYDHIAQEFSHMMRIRIVKMMKNGGPGAARQVGFDHSTGRYVMWMDADDTLVSSDAISTLVKEMERQQMDCVYGQFLEQNEDGGLYVHEQHMVWMK